MVETMNQVTSPSRFVALDGSINFRDFGGYRNQAGRLVKWRKLFRCGALSMLTGAAREEFSLFGISVICDLRRPDEAANSPTPVDPPFDVRYPIPIALGSNDMLRASLADRNHNAADRIRFMTQITRELARDHGDDYRVLFEQLVNANNGFLLHCSAGKDRTGFGVALILTALGVDRDTIMADYLLTNQAQSLKDYMTPRLRDFHGDHVDDASMDAVVGVRAEYLQAALDEAALRCGSLDNYLVEIGVDARVCATLKARLLEP